MSTSLDEDVKAGLAATRGDWQTVAKESGVSHSWISKFFNGHIENPGHETLKSLSAYLSKRLQPLATPKRKKAG